MKLLKVLRIIYDTVLTIAVVLCIVIFLFSQMLGLQSFIVLSGSMEPTIMVDDVVIIKPVDICEVKADDIITYTENDSYVTHRVVEITEKDGRKALRMKGDNNNVEDRELVTDDMVVGSYVFKVDGGANFYNFVHEPYGLIVLIGVPLLLYLILELIVYIKTPADTDDTTDDVDETTADTTTDTTVDTTADTTVDTDDTAENTSGENDNHH